MKKIISLLLVLSIVLIGAGDGFAVMAASSDYIAPWAEKEVAQAIKKNLIPADMQKDYLSNINREEFCILAIRLIESKSGKSIERFLNDAGKVIAPVGVFTDCDTKEVRAAKALGITEGTSATTFSPKMKLTREQAAKFLTTTAMAYGESVLLTKPDFVDNDEISDWAKPYAGYLRNKGVLRGDEGNRFNPKGSYQRQQAFMTVLRLWKVLQSKQATPTDEVLKILNNKPHPSNYKAVFKGERKDKDGVYAMRYEMLYSNDGRSEKYRFDSFLDDRRESVMLYYVTADMTFVRMILHSDYAQKIEGNWMPTKPLTEVNFSDDITGENFTHVKATIETKDGEKFIEVHKMDSYGATHSGLYSLENKLPIKYLVANGESVQTWKLDSFEENIEFGEKTFDEEAITNGEF